MTGVLAYCLTTSGSSPGPELAGVGGEPVFLHPLGDMSLWLSHTEHPPEPDLDAVRAHAGVVSSAWRRTTGCVPFRFGQWFGSVEEACEAVEERGKPLEEALEHLSGTAELDLKVLDRGAPPRTGEEDDGDAGEIPAPRPDTPDGGDGPGRAYIETLRARERERARRESLGDDLVGEIRRAVDGIVQDERVRRPRAERGLVDVAHLVPTDREDPWREAVDGVRRTHPELAFLVTGPWPPYSFAP